MSQVPGPGWNAFVSRRDEGRKGMAVPPGRDLLAVPLDMGAEALAADRPFSTSVLSNG